MFKTNYIANFQRLTGQHTVSCLFSVWSLKICDCTGMLCVMGSQEGEEDSSAFLKFSKTLTFSGKRYLHKTKNIWLLVAKDSGCSSRVVFLDISKAFDKVIHSAFLFMLRQLGVTGSVYNLLQSSLSGRSQFVRLGDFRSDHWHTNCGVPQGSVLGPLLCLV